MITDIPLGPIGPAGGNPLGEGGTLKAGISGHFSGQELVNKKALMQRLEQELAANIEGEPLPSLGYGGAEALFCIEKENAPNSNFPIFWWVITNFCRHCIPVMKAKLPGQKFK